MLIRFTHTIKTIGIRGVNRISMERTMPVRSTGDEDGERLDCQGKHTPIQTTASLLGSGGDYETVPVTLCRRCDLILELHTGPTESYDSDDE